MTSPGGNRVNRKEFTEEEVNTLLGKYVANNDPMQSLFSGKRVDSIRKWNYDLSSHMSRTSKRLLQHLINVHTDNVGKCTHCGVLMQLGDFIESEGRYRRFCTTCERKRVWFTEMRTDEEKKARGDKISASKKLWYASEEGKMFADKIGKINSFKMKAFNLTEEGKKNIELNRILNRECMLTKIANGEFFPPVTNSRTHWAAEIIINGVIKKFRSSWEACVWLSNQSWEYEKMRIPYLAEDGHIRTYIADFNLSDRRTIYEIKPTSMWEAQNTKMQQIIKYCLTNDIKFIWINEHNIFNYINEAMFAGPNTQQLLKLKQGIK